jgi:copper resistance protein C
MDMRIKKLRLASRFVVAFIAVYAMVNVFSPIAWAHAVLMSTQPSQNSTVSGPDVAVFLKYNSRVDIQHSTLTLLFPGGKLEKIAIKSEAAPGVLSARLMGLAKGAYELRWQVLAIDGHVTRGKLLFQVE